MKFSPLLFLVLAVGCGTRPSADSEPMQGSGATGLTATESAPRDNLRFLVTYDERFQTLSYRAWTEGHNAPSRVELPGRLSADGQPFIRETSVFGVSYSLVIEHVAPREVIETRLAYEGDGPDLILVPAMSRFTLAPAAVSKSKGMSVVWSGPALVEGEDVELLFREPSNDPRRMNDSTAGSVWGEKGLGNTVLWIDDATLRVAPTNAWTMTPIVAGQTYALRGVRRTSDGQYYSAEYVSADQSVLVSP